MATLAAIRDGLQTRLNTIAGLRAYDVWPDTMLVPAAMVMPSAMPLQDAMGSGNRRVIFEILLLAAPVQNGSVAAQNKLDAYLDETGTYSVIAALNADKTLGGAIDTLSVGWRDYGSHEVPMGSGAQYAGAVFDVVIYHH